MRLVRPLLGLVLGFSSVSSRILEDGELIDNNSILEVDSCLDSEVILESTWLDFFRILFKTLGGGEDGPGCVQPDCEQQFWSAVQHSKSGDHLLILSQVIIF